MTIDVNVNLSRWPFRRLPHDETLQLIEKLRTAGIVEAWAGSFDGLLHTDVSGVNLRLVKECQRSEGLLRPVGTVNLSLPDWQEDVRRCSEEHGMHAVRLHPNYHGYGFDSPLCDELLELATQWKLIVQVALKMEDVRTHHPLLRLPTVDVGPLEGLVRRHPDARLVLLNHHVNLRADQAATLAGLGRVYFDISHAELVGSLEQLIRTVPSERLLFGSHFPFFHVESAQLKFQESELGGAIEEALRSGNARTLMAQT